MFKANVALPQLHTYNAGWKDLSCGGFCAVSRMQEDLFAYFLKKISKSQVCFNFQ